MIEFKRLRESDLRLVLDWRLKDSVSQFLFTKVIDDMEKQIAWFRKISTDSRYRYWVIYYQQKPIGIFNLQNLDLLKKETNAGYYIGDETSRTLGGLIPPYFYNFVFQTLGLNRVYGEVVDGNPILKIHLMHGYRILDHYQKALPNGEGNVKVSSVELLAEDWLKQRKYKQYVCQFE